MTARERLDEYLASLRQRLRLAILTRAGAIVIASMLVALIGVVYFLSLAGFPIGGVIASRVALFVLVLALIGVLLWWPLRRLHNHSAEQFERHLANQDGRIRTYLEQQSRSEASLLTDLLAEDALQRAQQTPIEQVISPRRIWIAGAIAIACAVIFLGVLAISRSEWGYGSRYVLLGVQIPREAVPVREIALKPGDITMRRNADLKVQADVKGFKPDAVELFVRFADSDRWEQASMQHVNGEQYGFTLYAVRAPLSYYVRSGSVRSAEHAVRIVDVPRIEDMQLSYIYPDWTGLPPHVEKESRDISAVADTQVKVSVKSSEALQNPVVVIDRDVAAMDSNATTSQGSLKVSKPAHYHIAAQVAGEQIALTDDYEISVIDDEPPSIEVVKPGRDARASSIEEVPVTVRAKDDFKVQNVELHYAVNGGAWQKVKLPAQGAQVEAKTLLQLEELGGKAPLVPGDLITYYATTNDRKQSAQTDLFMVEVQPFERRFSEGQGGGGGGGGGNESEQQQIAERQRDLLVATWNLDRAREQKRRTPQQLKESADMLAGLQDKLAEQTSTLAARTRARASLETDARVKNFVESLESAVNAMKPASTNLTAIELQKAIPNEQTALQMLQRAEASFRDIQVARQQGGGGSGGSRTSRDIAELYELEMDLSKSKYETEKEVSQEERDQKVDDALEKLRELARRQEQLAQQLRQQQAQTDADRWKQEQLRREAEDLRKRLQQLTQQQMAQNGQQSGEQNSGQQSGSQSSSQSGSQSNQDANAALRSLDNALQAMRNAENKGDRSRASEDASRSLQQALDRMKAGADSEGSHSTLSKKIEQLAEQAKRLAEQQRKTEVDLHNALSSMPESDNSFSRMRRDGMKPDQVRKLAEQKNQMLTDLQALDERMRATAQSERRKAPQTSQRLSNIVDELASVNVPSRISRSIVDLERGRADQSVLGEGLITEALQNTASDLGDALRVARQEAEQKQQAADPDAVLAEIAQLRQALENAQRNRGQDAQRGQNQNAEANGSQRGAQNQNAQAQQGEGANSDVGSRTAGAASDGGGFDRGGIIREGVLSGRGTLAEQRIVEGDPRRAANTIREQLNAIQNRLAAGTITRVDLEALRALVPRIRYVARDPLANGGDMIRTVDGLELAALAAAEKARGRTASRAGANDSNAATDSETVAEYYRRLGK